MNTDPRAGTLIEPSAVLDVSKLIAAFYANKPDVSVPSQRVSFGTSGHRGSAFDTSFNENHIVAIVQAVCRHRAERGIDGPLFVGRDTHAVSEPAFYVTLEVLAANGVTTMVDAGNSVTPTPVVSHAIIDYNKGRSDGFADGIVITPSHNPPEDGGIKYNPPHGGPAETDITSWIEKAANVLLQDGLKDRSAPRKDSWPRRMPQSMIMSVVMSAGSPASSLWMRSTAPGCGSASTRWAARRCITGNRLPSASSSI